MHYQVCTNTLIDAGRGSSATGSLRTVAFLDPMRRLELIACIPLLGTTGCPDDPPADDTPMASGFAEESDAGEQGTTNNPDTSAGPDDSGGPGDGTAFQGDTRGVLTVTFTPQHALSDGDAVGMAGGYRIAEVGWDGLEDLYSPVAYQLAFPAAPDTADTVLPAEPVPVFDWGDMGDWLTAGNGMKLRQSEATDAELLACLVPTGNITGTYPLYRTTSSDDAPAECAPSPGSWAPSTVYDVVLYGGELFEDNVLLQRVTTPPALVVTAPDLSTFDAPLPVDQDLTVTWEPSDDPETRIIIRVIDADTNVVTAHAADDGDFTIPAAELAGLTLGPVDLVVARERIDPVHFTQGGLIVLGRYERWGFFDLF